MRERQLRAGRQLLKVAEVSPRVKRVYYYQAWSEPGRFDSALTDKDAVARPALCGLRAATSHKNCPGDPKPVQGPKPTPTPAATPTS